MREGDRAWALELGLSFESVLPHTVVHVGANRPPAVKLIESHGPQGASGFQGQWKGVI